MVPTPQRFVYKQVEGVDIDLDVYEDTSIIPNTQTPVVVYLHGGGFVLGNKEAVPKYIVEEVLRRKWILVSANYRLAPQTPIGEIYKDVIDVVTWVREELPKKTKSTLNPEKVSLWGSSAGGTLALLAGSYSKKVPNAIVAFYAATEILPTLQLGSTTKTTSLQSLPEQIRKAAQTPPVVVETPFEINPVTGGPEIQKFANHPRYQLVANANKYGCRVEVMTGLNPNSEADLPKFKDISPIHHIHSSYPPTYLVHGGADAMVPPEHSLNMTKELEKAERKVRLEIVPEKNHVFDFAINHGSEEYEKFVAPVFDFLQLQFGLAQ
ncbi:alpha/beta-hydrolase [Basidiobolus meristosporus CBS 931.73]|uniref:Alpha/beta-hydrolase n=1 Tax=Basidiobolus meristosporus CBS 931.73 TaxID=1314790 RepID=A0A1Y1YWL9_9FUNG|nr:alpha/beta-hydrolase [Basidiobolus meristosporus CBS 931.73]|eukprot:ORY01955.1 alpha/beta-hydrolase [Basidiobolus meristosporus CBS 931.73]